ncbi:MAG TPA: hypothetical protein VFA65_07950 [Bryobacteraceae bacterium]|nr:hypothetical protein [Bryobacteraceae bacterium]
MHANSRLLWFFGFGVVLWGASEQSNNWRAYGGDPTDIRYSSLKQINRSNVGQLKVAWTYNTMDGPGATQTEPIMVDAVLYGVTRLAWKRFWEAELLRGRQLYADGMALGMLPCVFESVGTRNTRSWFGNSTSAICRTFWSFIASPKRSGKSCAPTTDLIERVFVEVRRRTRAAHGLFRQLGQRRPHHLLHF